MPVARLTDPAYLAKLRGLIDDARAMPEMPPAGAADWARHRDTVYLCVVDGEGNACSFINSLFDSFGTGILAEERGRDAAEPRLRLPLAGRPPELHRARTSGPCTPSSPAWW